MPAIRLSLHPRIVSLFPTILRALQSKFAILRQCAAHCLAALCDVITTDIMRLVVEQVTPLLTGAVVLMNKQGAIEVVYGQLSFQCGVSLADNLCAIAQISSNFWMHKPYPILSSLSRKFSAAEAIQTTIFVTSLRTHSLRLSRWYHWKRVFRARLDSRQSCSQDAKQRGHSLHNCSMAPKSKTTGYPFQSRPNFASTNKVGSTGRRS